MQTDWLQFFGRFHPLLVHLPIGFVLFAAVLRLIAVYRKNVFLETSINIALLAGAIGALGSVLSGLFLSQSGGYNPATLSLHKWIGIAVTILLFIVWFARRKNKLLPFVKNSITNWLLITCIVLITIGGHLGGKMTHGEGYLTEFMPAALKPLFAVKKDVAGKKVIPELDSVRMYANVIQPIFDKHCVSCHNNDKNKGELVLTSKENIEKGGKSGNTIVPGDIDKSELFHRVTLSPQNKKFMPAGNASPLSPVEIFLIQHWINSGADFEKNMTDLGTDEKTRFLIAAYLGIDAEKQKEINLPVVPAFDSSIVQQLRKSGLIVRPLALGSNLLEVSFVMQQQKTVAEILLLLQKLEAIKQQLFRLDISNCSLSADCIKIIGGFTALNKLEIQKTGITDETASLLINLLRLEIVNAGQNDLTDKSISTFSTMPALKKINLWQTKITDNGFQNLRNDNKTLVVEQ